MSRNTTLCRSALLLLLCRGGSAQAPSREELQLLSGALPAINSQQWPEAEAKLKDSLAAYPRSPVLSNALGMVYHSEHKDTQALQAFQNAIDWLPNFTAAQLHLGSLLAERSECKEASPLLIAAASGTTDAGALATAGAGMAQCREFASAADVFERAHQANPQSSETSFNLALARFANGEYGKALDSLQTITSAADNERPEVLLLRARLLQATNQPGADEALSAACAKRPEEESCNDAAVALIRQSHFAQAAKLLSVATQSLPRSATVLSTLGLAQFQLGRYAEATSAYRKAIQLDPKLDAPREGLGFLLYTTGDLQAAKAIIEAALQEPNPDFYLPYLHALVLYRLGRPLWPDALKSIQAAMAANNKFAPAYFLRGKISMENGNLDGAITDFQHAVDLDPKYALPYYKMAQIYDRQGSSEKAETARQRFAQLGSLREEEVLERQTQNQVLAKR